MAFINWGSESPEHLAIRKRMEDDMMFEQAAFNAAMAAAAATGAGGSRVDKSENKYVVSDYIEDYFE